MLSLISKLTITTIITKLRKMKNLGKKSCYCLGGFFNNGFSAKLSLLLAFLLMAFQWIQGQTFAPQDVISTNASSAQDVEVSDLDGDGDLDVLSGSLADDKVAWYENDSSQNFTAHTISTQFDAVRDIQVDDLDGDGDLDVLVASQGDDLVGWFENDGNQNFTRDTIATNLDGAAYVYTEDLNQDGHLDVITASYNDDKVAWHENNGSQQFTTHVISTNAALTGCVYAADMDNDGDTDVLSASASDNKIAWYENDGSQNFTTHAITTNAKGAWDVHAVDLDGDNDQDVLSASWTDNKIAWYENDGNQNFTKHVISANAGSAWDVDVGDIDNDGDKDVLGASSFGDYVAWYENDGSQNFTTNIISKNITKGRRIKTGDWQGDGDLDVFSASEGDNKIAWYENLINLKSKKSDSLNVNALEFYGKGGHIETDSTSAFDLKGADPVTVSLWIKTKQKVDQGKRVNPVMITEKGQTRGSGHDKGIQINSNGQATFYIFDGTEVRAYSKTRVNDGKWHHIAGVFDGSKIYTYVDGKMENSSAASKTHNFKSPHLVMSFLKDGRHQWFKGKIQRLHVWNKAKSGNEIRNEICDSILPYNKDLIAYYDLNGGGDTVQDLIRSNNGKINKIGNTRPEWILDSASFNCAKGNSLKFSGNKDYLETYTSSSFDLKAKDPVTVSLWLKTSQEVAKGKKANPVMITERGQTKGSGHDKGIQINNKGQVTFYVFNGSEVRAYSNTKVNDGEWHHVTGVFNGSNIYTYVDGKLEASKKVNKTHNFNSPHLVLSFLKDQRHEWYKGFIDEVRIWNKARSQSAIQKAMCGPVDTSNHSHLQAYYDLNGTGKIVNDLSGNFNDFAYSGANQNPIRVKNAIDACLKGYALNFDGVDDEVRSGKGAKSSNYQEWSCGMWVKPENWDNNKREDIFSINENWSSRPLNLALENGYLKHFRGQAAHEVMKFNVSNLNGWHFLALTQDRKDSNTVKVNMFVDSNKVQSITGNYEDMNTKNLTIGATMDPKKNNQSENFFNGLIDDVSIWGKEISKKQIEGYLCSNSIETPKNSNLIANWDFNEGEGSLAYDLLGNYNGSLKPTGSKGPQWVIDSFSKGECGKNSIVVNVPDCSNCGKKVVDYSQGLTIKGDTIKTSRSKPSHVIGQPRPDTFFSLGFGQKSFITVAFDSFMTGDLTIYESTWNSTNYPEKADVYVSEDQTSWYYVGEADNQNNKSGDLHPFTFALDSIRYKYVKVVNTTDSTQFGGDADGFDLNAVCAGKVAPVQELNPEPACQYYGQKIIDYKQGAYKNGNSIAAARSNPKNALGQPSLHLYSLGFQDTMSQKPYVILGFKDLMTGKLSVYEHDNNPLEKAKVYVSKDTSNWTYVGVAHNYNHAFGEQYATTFNLDSINYQYVKLVNATKKANWGPKGDGFDLTGICAEKQVPSGPLKTLTKGCFTVKYLDSQNNPQKGTMKKVYRVINNCNKGWSYTAFELKPGTQVLSYASKGNYPVENTTNNPFHSIKFECHKPDCFKNGDSSWFQFTINQKDTLSDVKVRSQAGLNQGTVTFSNEPTDEEESAGIDGDEKDQWKVYPNPVKQGSPLTIQWSGTTGKAEEARLLNAQGQVAKRFKMEKGRQASKVNTSGLSKGMYLLQTNNKTIKRIIIF